MADLLLELFSEEIPARMQADALEHLQNALTTKLNQSTRGFVTPRRIAAIVSNLPAMQADINTELKGPKVGAPQAAIDGFLKKSGMTLDQLQQQDGVYIAKIHQKGKPTAEILKPLIEDILKSFPWPKSMRWGANETTWVRPLHSILCIFDGKVVPVEFAGIKAGNTTRGHRFMAPGAITITDPNQYESALEKAFVIADRQKRQDRIERDVRTMANAKGLDDALNSPFFDVTGLVEWPVALMGTIDERFMDLPAEVLTTVMRNHQKYFALVPQKDDLSPSVIAREFILVANIETSDGGKAIVAGNERVLRARFSDARFFWDQDRKKKLDAWAADLKDVTFHAKLGTIADKVERVKELAGELTAHTKADKKLVERVVELCKADLVTGMVGEFAELQGVMGRYYALAQKEKPEVADAIRDHYLPLSPHHRVPKAPVAITVALADKLDTLISMFAIGEKPTGSKDPFALRRAALGIIRIILENNIRLPLLAAFDNAPLKDIAIHKAHDKLAKKTEERLKETAPGKVGKYLTVNESASEDIPEGAIQSLSKSLLAFFHDRLIVQLKDSGIRHDVIKAVVADGDDDLLRVVARAKAVQGLLDTDDGKNLLAGYKRATNILSIEEKKDKTRYEAEGLNQEALAEPQEKQLVGQLVLAKGSMGQAMQRWEFAESSQRLGALRPYIDAFFDKTLVNCDDAELRKNRLRLLAGIRDCMNLIADFSVIESDGKEQKKAA